MFDIYFIIETRFTHKFKLILYFIIIVPRWIVIDFVLRIRENTMPKRLKWTEPEVRNWMKNKRNES